MGLFAPAWQSKDKDKRLKAVEALGDQALLARIAADDPDGDVFTAAAARVADERVLMMVAAEQELAAIPIEDILGARIKALEEAAAGVTSPNVKSQVDRKIEALRELADFAGSFGSKLRGQLVRRGVAARGDGFDDFIRSLWPNGLAIDADAKIRVASAVWAVASSRGSEELARIVAESGESGPVLVDLQLAKPCRPVDRKSGTIPCERTLGMLKALVSVYKSERGL